MTLNRKTIIRVIALIAVIAAGWGAWTLLQPKGLPDGFVSGNGRIEAVEIDVSAKSPGRIAEILANEGDLVKQGQVLVHMDVSVLAAQKAEAEARLQQARTSVFAAESQVLQASSQAATAQAIVAQREAELEAARRRLNRSRTLAEEGAAAQQETDDDQTRVASAQAALNAARAQVAAAASSVDAAQATIVRLQADIDDSDLKAPRDGRVQFRVAQVGEVVAGGGKVLNLVDLSDVYMTFYLPEQAAGRVALGTPVRLVLDAAPDRPIPATISFVADVAQFTPKTVETESERQKLMFRVRARIDPALLRANIDQVKTGLPGVAYVQLDRTQSWPANLTVRGGSNDR